MDNETESFQDLATFRTKQQLRLKRFAMAVATYCMAVFALFVVTRLGLGTLSFDQWVVILGLSFVGNSIFMTLFMTGLNCYFKDPSLTRKQIIFATFWGMFPLWWLPDARAVILMFFLPAFGFGVLRLNFRQYLTVVGWNMVFYGIMLVGEFVVKRPGFQPGYELFLYGLYAILIIWMSVFGGFVSKMRKQLNKANQTIKTAHEDLKKETEVRRRAEMEKDQLISNLQKTVQEVKALSGLLPICANCKKIRDDNGYWNQIEAYIRDHSEADFSHSICPECAILLYPELYGEKA